jgi:hypothetical protein
MKKTIVAWNPKTMTTKYLLYDENAHEKFLPQYHD